VRYITGLVFSASVDEPAKMTFTTLPGMTHEGGAVPRTFQPPAAKKGVKRRGYWTMHQVVRWRSTPFEDAAVSGQTQWILFHRQLL
jgi:hypothetical protein